MQEALQIKDLKMYYTWVYNVIYRLFKKNIWFNIKLKMVKVLV
jgi:hypothetical protein